MALPLSQNGLRSDLNAFNFLKNFLGEHAPDRPIEVITLFFQTGYIPL